MMGRQIKIAFGCKMRSGKDTSVNYLIKKYGGKRLSFATPIYDILHYAQKVCDFPIKKDREFLQWVGTNWGRGKDEDVWVKKLLRETPEDGNVFISDLRFFNEFQLLKEDGWICVCINRFNNCQEEKDIKRYIHPSETNLDRISQSRWDYIIDNNGTLEELYEKLDKIYDNESQK